MNSLMDHLHVYLRLWERLIVCLSNTVAPAVIAKYWDAVAWEIVFLLLFFWFLYFCALATANLSLWSCVLLLNHKKYYSNMKIKLSFWNYDVDHPYFHLHNGYYRSLITIFNNTNTSSFKSWAELRCFVCPWSLWSSPR